MNDSQSMSSTHKRDKEVVEEFCELYEQSKSLFDGLRDLPSFGQRHWQSHFRQTFEIFTKLWKFQQDNRAILDLRYNLKRWQIGEIASRIGQLYYHYYLRTGDTNYLYEAAQFYTAIRSRAYFSQANKDDKPHLMVKKLRYYARYLVVALLLNDSQLARDLVQELRLYVDDYHSTYCTSPESAASEEWRQVLKEASTFLQADTVFAVVDDDIQAVQLRHRLSKEDIPSVKTRDNQSYTLQEIIVVGNCENQMKFSELTLDMYRILQVLEYEPDGLKSYQMLQHNITNGSKQLGTQPIPSLGDHHNPHKYLLYKPSISQLLTYLAAGMKDLPAKGIQLIYLSADGLEPQDPKSDHGLYKNGGVVTNRKKAGTHSNAMSSNVRESNGLYVEDLMPFTRKPLVVIVDSPRSDSFTSWPPVFGQPVICLMSPQSSSPSIKPNKHGNLFTMFLYDPLMAICQICNRSDVPLSTWNRGNDLLRKLSMEVLQLLSEPIAGTDSSFLALLNDEFVRIMILRFAISVIALRRHKHTKGPQFVPSSTPALPSSVLDNPTINRHFLDLTSVFEISEMFHQENELSTGLLI